MTTEPGRLAPQSYEQQRLSLFEGLDDGGVASNVAYIHWITGALDTTALTAAIAAVHARHEVLRTRYPDVSTQEVLPVGEAPLEHLDLSTGPDPEAALRRLVDRRVGRPFDLAAGPPVRWIRAALGPDRHALAMVVHHIAMDAWSLAVLNGDISELYSAFHTGRLPRLPELPTTYAGYATEQRDRDGAAAAPELDYWVTELAGLPGPTRLPFDRPAGHETGRRGGVRRAPIPPSLVSAAASLAKAERASLFMVLLAAFSWQLAWCGDQRDFVVGVPNAGRDQDGLDAVVGCFIDTRPCRIRLGEAPTFRELLAVVRKSTLDSYRHGALSLERVVAAVGPDREPGRDPLVQVSFGVTNTPDAGLRLAGLEVTEEERFSPATALDLAVIVLDEPAGLTGMWQYRADLFDPGTIAGLQADFERIVRWATANPDRPLTGFAGFTIGSGVDGADVTAGPAAADDDAEAAPRTGTEELVARLWCETLGLDWVGVGEDFFELGGHSLVAAQLVARIEARLPGLPVRGLMRDVLRYPTVRRFAAVLDERLAGLAVPEPRRVPILPRGEALPLSLGQKRLWFLDQFVNDSAEYLVPWILRVSGPLDTGALVAALTEIVARHEVLRTSVVVAADDPVGIVRDVTAFTVAVAECSAAALTATITAETTRPLDLAAGLPIRATLLRLGDADHVLCLTVHHMVFDNWSAGLLHEELDTLYGAFTAGQPSPLPPLVVQYADVTAAQESGQDGPEFAAKLDFWRTELAGAEAFELAPDLPRPARRTSPGRTVSFSVPEDVLAGLERIGTRHGATTFMTLLAAWQVLLHRCTGADDLTVGTTAADRELTESEPLIGLFINMLVLRGDLSGRPAFGELLARTRDRTLEAYAHQDVPFDRLVEELAPERDLARTPIFQVMVKLDSGRQRPPTLPGLTVRRLANAPVPAKYDIELTFAPNPTGGLSGELSYDTGLYLPDTIDRLIGHFRTLLTDIADDPDRPIDRLALMDAAGRAEAAALAARPEVPVPALCLHELIALRIADTPDAVAVVQDDRALGYAELGRWSDAVAAWLREHGAGPDVVVGVVLDRSIELVVALLGVLKAGSAYLPIEPGTPPARITQLLRDSGAPVCLVEPRVAGVVTEAGSRALLVPMRQSAARGPVPAPMVDPGHLAAVYYTSGSTGRPKGVACTHGGWVNRMHWMQRHHPLGAGETVLHKTTITFDDAAVEIFWPLMSGATVAVLGPGRHRDPRAIADAVIRYHAVHVQFVPSMLELFLDTVTGADVRRMPALRSVLSSGEALRPELAGRFREVFGESVVLDNTWGATEVSIDSTCHVCRSEDATGTAVPIGRPIDNNEVRVLDPRFEEVPVGVPGELCIGGAGLARGYLGDPRRTAEVFVPHPERAGERLYRTGDWGRRGRDGVLVFLRRKDDQVKIRGVRVELGEVEHALRAHPAVADAVVVAWTAAPGDKRLAGYVVAGCSSRELLEHARAVLPVYAVPGSITVLDALPRLPSGKLDRKNLPEPAVTGHEDSFLAPRTATEKVLAGIWADVLGRDRVGVEDDFFAIGGHSLLATRAIARMRQAFVAELPLTLIFERPTVARMAEAIEEIVLAEVAGLTDAEARELLS
ncbi:non-ribosomal peptide synthetase [Amycolatopsis mediterranei S699]|uniref:Non-ribosomal peptide synthetase n=3 Tax=Amycolatopsis mediterranei TaxID=33910 RepID=A0A0H3D6A6_AMYMU|nr:non-ribosomal peptide synthetase [Amycolatopsis mediterranei]ADJ46535.1 non-ribosomal peptide synthetase [Amycolatopsis mediterranei U32]AEK43335.1 non-ribosomal peptide synthetase [Amycolatopsis mediterranei S699]AFO78246.1 non-ribosomal peptide synthetase [Amycolatopsis mediterranei S699]AGT85374.1 non-ribosomal peptide synthetase [Amycolatopsis mediterranei RB]KDO06192.1 peptide synthetase [Amycolatopsis mediterranei]